MLKIAASTLLVLGIFALYIGMTKESDSDFTRPIDILRESSSRSDTVSNWTAESRTMGHSRGTPFSRLTHEVRVGEDYYVLVQTLPSGASNEELFFRGRPYHRDPNGDWKEPSVTSRHREVLRDSYRFEGGKESVEEEATFGLPTNMIVAVELLGMAQGQYHIAFMLNTSDLPMPVADGLGFPDRIEQSYEVWINTESFFLERILSRTVQFDNDMEVSREETTSDFRRGDAEVTLPGPLPVE